LDRFNFFLISWYTQRVIGAIDSYAGIVEVLKRRGGGTGVLSISHHRPKAIAIRHDAQVISLDFSERPVAPFKVGVYTTSGQLLLQRTFQPSGTHYQLSVSSKKSEVLAIKVDGGT
jgi:hypothetical protein